MDLSNPEEIKKLISLLQTLVDQNSKESDDEPESKIKTKTARSGNKKKMKNKFLDMPEKNMHKEDSAIDKRLNVHPPTLRNRKFIPVEVTCRSCGKKEKVNPAIVPESTDRYKCNKCSSSAGA
jgi:lysyl-tRNA synthetase class I